MQAEQPSGLGTQCVPPATGGLRCHCVAVSYLCLRAPVFSTWELASLAGGEMCFQHHRFPLDVISVTGDEIEACQSQLVDLKLVYIFRIILYD